MAFDLKVDTALSTEGRFPKPSQRDYVARVYSRLPHKRGSGGWDVLHLEILVSSRYTAPTKQEAAELAVDAAAERWNWHGTEYSVRVHRPGKRADTRYLVRFDKYGAPVARRR